MGSFPKGGTIPTRWAPTSYKWSYKPYKWPYKLVTGVITLLIGVITPFITGRGPPCKVYLQNPNFARFLGHSKDMSCPFRTING